MGIIESLRQKFSNNLQLHQIDDDYTTPSRLLRPSSSSNLASQTQHTLHSYYDPDESVPSYEISQRLHDSSRGIVDNSVLNTTITRNGTSNNNRVFSNESSSNSISAPQNQPRQVNGKKSLKHLGLKFLNAKQHFALAICRDLSLVPCLFSLFQSWKRAFFYDHVMNSLSSGYIPDSLTGARPSEHFLTGIWCLVAGYLSYSVLDGLMVRWIVTYSTSATIVRMLSMSTIIITIEQYLVAAFSANGYNYGLHIWILISCCLTFTYIVQNFVTSNLDLKGKRRARFFDFYNIVVFAVVPVGLASFITMIGLLRSLLILRLDIDSRETLF